MSGLKFQTSGKSRTITALILMFSFGFPFMLAPVAQEKLDKTNKVEFLYLDVKVHLCSLQVNSDSLKTKCNIAGI